MAKSKPKPKRITPSSRARARPARPIKLRADPGRKPTHTPTSAEARRLAAELATRPEDLELQKIYADALLDQGGVHAVRGELVQRTLASLPTPPELLESFEQALGVRGIVGLLHAGGFARSWTCSSDDFGSFAAELFAEEPLLREVIIRLGHRDAHLQLATVAATPELARVRRLGIVGHQQRAGRPGASGLAQLLASPFWPRLEALKLPNCALRDAGAKRLAETASLAQLRELDLAENDLTSKGVIALAESPHLANLSRLVLIGNKPALRGIAALAKSPHIRELEFIDTSKTWLAKHEVRAIKQRWPAIEHKHN